MKENNPSAGDKWGRDPSVQYMRRVFALMEASQKEILRALDITLLDGRLRVWRQDALCLFEQAWNQLTLKGYRFAERQLADLYCVCFAGILRKAGISVPTAVLPSDEEVIRLMRDVSL